MLVLGGRGLLGTHLSAVLGETVQPADLAIHREERFSQPADLLAFLDHVRPKVVANCLGYKGTDPQGHFLVHACLPRIVADWCASNRASAIHVSTNAVFESSEVRYWSPGDPIRPKTVYEVAKAFGEDPRALVIRTSFIGHDPRSQGLWDSLAEGRPYADRRWNGVTALTLARFVAQRATSGKVSPGLVHLHSPDTIEFSDLARWLGSASKPEGWGTSHLLAGGPLLPPLADQVHEYVDHLNALIRKA